MSKSVSRNHSSSSYRLGIIGGGQLAKMTALAAQRLGCEIVILERQADSPTEGMARETLIGDWDDAKNIIALAQASDVVGLENEFVAAEAIQAAEEAGHTILPTAKTMALVQDKLIQKQTLESHDIALPAFQAVENREDITTFASQHGWPVVLKSRRNGYDGKGNATVREQGDIESAWTQLSGNEGNALYVEAFCPFRKELAVMVTRARSGEMICYPVVETIQRDHICHTVIAPANVSDGVIERAIETAKKAVLAIDGVGTIGIEMFLTADDQILLNEMAPRVHNSGHYTIEACACSQFENHVRALLDLPLGSPEMMTHCAVMVNLLGESEGSGYPEGIDQAMAIEGVHFHSYGKRQSRKGRKMGHLTVLGDNPDQTREKAEAAAQHIHYGAG